MENSATVSRAGIMFTTVVTIFLSRMPGWAADFLRPGSPAGLLARRLAEAAARRGLPLWIPNVDREALPEVLRLPGTIWVDGPSVPRQNV